MNYQDFSQAYTVITLAYPTFTPKDGTMGMYFKLLEDLPDGIIQAAAIQAVNDCPFFPSVAELRAAANRIIAASKPAQKLPTEAWDEVLKLNNRRCDEPCPPVGDFSSEAVWRAARGLWSRLSGTTATYDENALGFIQRDFIESYKGAVVQAQNDERLLPASTAAAGRIAEGVNSLVGRLGAGK